MEVVLVLITGVSVVTLIVISTLLFRAFPAASAVRVNAYLGCYYLCIAYVLFVTTLVESEAIFKYPHFYRTGLIFMYIALPFPYFYFKKLLLNEPFKLQDMLHFLFPALLILDLLPFFFSSAEYKKEVLIQNLSVHEDRYFLSKESYLGIGLLHMIARFGMVVFYLSQQAKCLTRIKAGFGIASLYKRSDWQKWLNFFFISNGSVGILLFVFFVIGREEIMWTSSIIVISLFSLISTFYLLFAPSILHSYLELEPVSTVQSDNEQQQEPEISLKGNVQEKIFNRVVGEKAYLIPKYTLHQLSLEIEVPSTTISQFLQDEYQATFYDYVNTHRVRYIEDRLREMNPSEVIFDVLAKEAGFSNRTSFSNAFKRVTGKAPSSYLQSMKASASD